MLVKDVMTKSVITVSPDTPMKTVGRLFKEKRISGLPVMDSSGELIGVVTVTDMLKMLNDIYRWSELEGGDPDLGISKEFEDEKAKATVEKTMTRRVFTVEEEMDVREVLRLMFDQNVHTIPVTNDNELVGVVGVRDIIAACF